MTLKLLDKLSRSSRRDRNTHEPTEALIPCEYFIKDRFVSERLIDDSSNELYYAEK